MTDRETPTSGFMNPPKHTQFQKGKSGNPRGRPRKRDDLNTVLERVLKRKVPVRDEERKVPIRDALIWRLRDLALQGDKQALSLQRRIIEQAGLDQTDAHDPEAKKIEFLKALENMGVPVKWEK
ncbi:DUF5681 domain-containing protein [uncultured Shimia sp.]|uniref:DUF5681 domain-containing protein n=1 Tax=uncultured Shimia sp. TaxID=573152 RepID=UPI0026148650|nr:DUF5681 domain-containing protein [uncultured Shimia sp.]